MDQITSFLLLKQVRLLLGILAFIGLLSLDVLKAWKSKAHWVPAGALVLSAFSLQLLDLLDTDNVSISDYPDAQRWDLERVLRKGLLIDGGRVMVCVYMGYLLPEMARSPSKTVVWSDIGALALSMTTHIFSELYVIKELCSNTRQAYIPVDESQGYVQLHNASALSPSQMIIPLNRLSILSRLCTGLCVVCLFLILGSAAFAGRSLYNIVWEKIPVALNEEATDNYGPDDIERDVLQSWVVAWVCKPDFVIARSVLASSVGVVVTISVLVFAAEWTTQNYQVLHSNDGIDWVRYTVTAFMTLLIFMGWGIIFYRWMFAIFYFPGKHRIRYMEDFWIRHIYEVMDGIRYARASWDQRVCGGGLLKNRMLFFLQKFKLHKLLCHPLLCLQRRVIWFSKRCCSFSEKIFFVDRTRSRIVGGVDHELLAHFREVLGKVTVTGETTEFLLAGSLKALKQTKDFKEKGRREGSNSRRLIQFLRDFSSDQNSEGRVFLGTLEVSLSGDLRFDYLRKVSWLMTALSLIHVIIQLEGRGARDAVDAYSEAYDFLELLDNPAGNDENFLPELLVRASDIKFKDIKQQLERNRAASPEKTGSMQVARQKVMDLQQKPKLLPYIPHDSVDWWAVAADNCLDKVWTIILENGTSSETADYTPLANRVRKILADILAVALKEKVGIELVNRCREWAKLLNVEKIKASVYIAGKLNGVIRNLNEAVQPETIDGDLGVSNFNPLYIGA